MSIREDLTLWGRHIDHTVVITLENGVPATAFCETCKEHLPTERLAVGAPNVATTDKPHNWPSRESPWSSDS